MYKRQGIECAIGGYRCIALLWVVVRVMLEGGGGTGVRLEGMRVFRVSLLAGDGRGPLF